MACPRPYPRGCGMAAQVRFDTSVGCCQLLALTDLRLRGGERPFSVDRQPNCERKDRDCCSNATSTIERCVYSATSQGGLPGFPECLVSAFSGRGQNIDPSFFRSSSPLAISDTPPSSGMFRVSRLGFIKPQRASYFSIRDSSVRRLSHHEHLFLR